MSGPKVGYKHFWPIAVLVITGVLLTTIVALFIQQSEQSKVRAEFVHVTVDNLRAIRGTLAWHVELLEATTALHTAVPALTHEEFTSFVQPLLATRPAIDRLLNSSIIGL
jgi:CHASE1-domain containing sensor protein